MPNIEPIPSNIHQLQALAEGEADAAQHQAGDDIEHHDGDAVAILRVEHILLEGVHVQPEQLAPIARLAEGDVGAPEHGAGHGENRHDHHEEDDLDVVEHVGNVEKAQDEQDATGDEAGDLDRLQLVVVRARDGHLAIGIADDEERGHCRQLYNNNDNNNNIHPQQLINIVDNPG